MKKWIKVILIIAGCLAAVGIALDLVVLATHGFDIKKIAIEPDPESMGLVEHEFQSQQGNYQRIQCYGGDMDVFVSSENVDKVQVTVWENKGWLEGDESNLTLTETGNGVLDIKYKHDGPLDFSATTWSFGRTTQPTGIWITLPQDYSGALDFENGSGYLEITGVGTSQPVPLTAKTGSGDMYIATCALSTLKVDTGSGYIALRDSTAQGAAELKAGSGDISIADIQAGTLSCETGSGSLGLERVKAAEGISVAAGSGNAWLYRAIGKTLTVTTQSGDQDLDQVDADDIRLSANSGEIRIEAPGAYDDWKLDLETQSGDCIVTDETGEERGRHHTDTGNRSLTVSTGSGDILVDFVWSGSNPEELEG